jgi:hypothetical protein
MISPSLKAAVPGSGEWRIANRAQMPKSKEKDERLENGGAIKATAPNAPSRKTRKIFVLVPRRAQ